MIRTGDGDDGDDGDEEEEEEEEKEVICADGERAYVQNPGGYVRLHNSLILVVNWGLGMNGKQYPPWPYYFFAAPRFRNIRLSVEQPH